VAITVADNGPGLSPEVQSQLFRTGMTTRAAQGGSGLGLMIVKRIVDANGGHIGVESPAGVGASFRVVFPTALS
jgi:signal transduction histidine kinase